MSLLFVESDQSKAQIILTVLSECIFIALYLALHASFYLQWLILIQWIMSLSMRLRFTDCWTGLWMYYRIRSHSRALTTSLKHVFIIGSQWDFCHKNCFNPHDIIAFHLDMSISRFPACISHMYLIMSMPLNVCLCQY